MGSSHFIFRTLYLQCTLKSGNKTSRAGARETDTTLAGVNLHRDRPHLTSVCIRCIGPDKTCELPTSSSYKSRIYCASYLGERSEACEVPESVVCEVVAPPLSLHDRNTSFNSVRQKLQAQLGDEGGQANVG